MDERGFAQAQRIAERSVDAEIAAAQQRTSARPLSDHCLDCGAVISVARRMVAPFAERCVDCQNEREKSKR